MIWLLIGYMWLFIHRPFEIWPVLATIQIERLYVIAAVLATIFTSQGMVRSSLNRAWLVFAAAVLICWMASPWRDTALAGTLVSNWLKILVFYFLVIFNVRTERDLQLLVTGFVGVISLFMLHSIWEFHQGRRTFRMGIARMNGINVFFQHPNNFSATLVFALPFYGLLYRISRSQWMRYGVVAGIVGILYCVINTGSRTSMVGMVGAAGLVAMRSPHRGRLLLAALILLPVGWGLVPADKQARFLTILGDSFYEEQPGSAQTSADTRTEGFYEGWQLFREHPWTGVGPGAWIPASGWTIESHNLYGQLPGEMGLVGMGAFALVLGAYWTNLRQIRGLLQATDHPSFFLDRLRLAIGDATILMLLLGMAGHNLFRFNWIWHASFLAVAVHVASEQYEYGGSGGDPDGELESDDENAYLSDDDSDDWEEDDWEEDDFDSLAKEVEAELDLDADRDREIRDARQGEKQL